MPSVTPGNRLYLYQLFSRELGFGRQVPLTRVSEVLEADGIAPEDLGFEDVRALCEGLDGMIKLTAFKKGQVVATVIADEEYDRALARLANEAAAEKSSSAGRSYKYRKGTKYLKPVKPRHVVIRTEETNVSEPAVEATTEAAEPAVETSTGTAESTPSVEAIGETQVDQATESEAVAESAAAESEAKPAATKPETEPEALVAEAKPKTEEAELTPEEEAELEPEPEAAVELVAELVASPEPRLATETESTPLILTPEPTIKLRVTYVPEAEPIEELFEPQPEPEPLCEHEPEPASEPAVPIAAPLSTPKPSRDLPQDFYTDVYCPNAQLSILYQILPPDVEPISTLEEDFRIARSTDALEGTRSEITFPLRYLRADGSPVTVTLRRSVRGSVAGKHWTLEKVTADAPEEVSLEGLSEQESGAWSAFFSPAIYEKGACDPVRTLAQTVALGSWDELLDTLANLAHAEAWGPEHKVLRDYLAMTFTRIMNQSKLAESPDGSIAAFDTGLLTDSGSPIRANLEHLDGDIPWKLVGFSTSPDQSLDPIPASYATTLAETVFDPRLESPEFFGREALKRNPRLATTAYDPLADRVVLLVPGVDENSKVSYALAFSVTSEGYELTTTLSLEDAYTCARVVSAEQPTWLSAWLE